MTAAQSTKARSTRKASLVTSAALVATSPAKTGRAKKASATSSTATWHEMVATAAYYRAQARGFQPGLAEQDWLDAEAELIRGMSKIQQG